MSDDDVTSLSFSLVSFVNTREQAPQDVASMARAEYRDFSEFEETEKPRKKSLDETPVITQPPPTNAQSGNFFDTLDWDDGNK